MELGKIFFKAFFYPFLVGVCLSTLVVTLFLGLFINHNLDKRTSNNIINLEKKFSKININNVNILLTTSLLKFQAGLNEQILFYQKTAKDLLNSEKEHEIKTDHLKCTLKIIDEQFCEIHLNETPYISVWLYDEVTTAENFDDSKKEVKQQLIAYSNLIPNIDSSFEANKPNVISYFFYSEKTELYISYPLFIDCESKFIYEMKNFTNKTFTCINDQGQIYDIYKMKCETFYANIVKTGTNAFDNNYLSNQNRTIYVLNYNRKKKTREFIMCIKFDDPITNDKGYVCVEVNNEDMFFSLENLNSNLVGYFFISSVGFNNMFYFPQGSVIAKTSTENIFRWDLNFILEEKAQFYNILRKIFSSNYNDNISGIFDEIYINGKDSNEQYFYLGGEKFKYSIYPLLLENLNKKKEHIFSIIYIYNEHLFFEELENNISSTTTNLMLELILVIIFGSGLLYIIYLTFNTLSKYIVIPIKNINYMLKGINIGGENRLDYLHFLKKKHEENLEKLEKMYIYENRKNINEKESMNETGMGFDDNFENEYQDNNNLMSKEKRRINKEINPYEDFNNKYDEESNYIEKEFSFYDFDELLLQYRPLEIEQLVESLINLKSALITTSSDREVEQLIDYSNSENIFRTFKNKEGSNICHSNIGNLQTQLLKFDKAIYHIALSLQDNKLKRFLIRNLSDEYDESDSLLNKISYSFNKGKKVEKYNILADKQLNNSKENFSQKIIGILINTRYCRLIHAYYMFFKNLQKLQKLKKSNDDIINGQFMNTFFHTINYYHKTIIQYIYLSFVKNDLVKIGESILDYIEFLIKFKFKSIRKDEYFLKINNSNRPEFRKKIEFKKIIFDKIINWFNLFDDYISHVKDNSTLSDVKNIVDDYFHNLNSDNSELNLESQSTLMFRINLQRGDFLKAKFCLCCKNYNDAFFYFIRAAKKKNIAIDGLIKKRSLKHIFKLLMKMKKKYEIFGLKNLFLEKELKEFKKNQFKDKNKIINKRIKNIRKTTNSSVNANGKNGLTFGEEIEIIKRDIFQDINECNAKQEKDTIILIDFNIYNVKEENNYYKNSKIDAFIEQTSIILNSYLSTNDRLSVLIYFNDHQIICPLMNVSKIDIKSFTKDLIYYKNLIFNDNYETEEYDINFDELNLKENNLSEHSHEDSIEFSEKELELKFINKISGLVKAINYIISYSRMKEGLKTEKYIILFTDMLNIKCTDDEQINKIEKIFKKLKGDKESVFLLVGKNKKFNSKKENNKCREIENNLEELILTQYGGKSESINFENMKKIKTILSNNNVIKDEVIYPNELYK